MTYGKISNENYDRNIHVIKIITGAVLLCAEQGIALGGLRKQDSSNDAGKISVPEKTMQRAKFLANINVFAASDTVLMKY